MKFGTEEQKKRFCDIILSGKFGAFALTEPQAGSDAANGKTYRGVTAKITALPIDALKLSIRAYNCLLRLGCKTIGDCMVLKKEQILNVRNFGVKSRNEIALALQKFDVLDTVWDEFVL